jgi:hypothetical protein
MSAFIPKPLIVLTSHEDRDIRRRLPSTHLHHDRITANSDLHLPTFPPTSTSPSQLRLFSVPTSYPYSIQCLRLLTRAALVYSYTVAHTQQRRLASSAPSALSQCCYLTRISMPARAPFHMFCNRCMQYRTMWLFTPRYITVARFTCRAGAAPRFLSQ